MKISSRLKKIEAITSPPKSKVVWCRYQVAHRPERPITGLQMESPVNFSLPRLPDETINDLWARFEQEAGPMVRENASCPEMPVGIVFATYEGEADFLKALEAI